MTALVSIITPNFNRADLIIETAQSIFKQTFTNWEWIIIDDGSTDASMDVLQRLASEDSRIKVFQRNRAPKGACACRNIGVEISVGRYLIFLDSDDLLEPFCLDQRINAFEKEDNLDFAIFPSLMFCKNPFDLNLWWNIDKPMTELVRQFHQDAICQSTGVIWQRKAFIELGQWDERLQLWQDIDLYLRAYILNYRYKKFFDLPPDLHNRVSSNSLSRGNFFDTKKQESRIIVIKKAVELLNDFQLNDLKREAKYMLTEIISGFIRTGYFAKANELMRWGLAEGVFDNTESSILRWYKNAYKFKLVKFSFIQKKLDQYLIPLRISNTLGKLPFKEGMKTNPI